MKSAQAAPSRAGMSAAKSTARSGKASLGVGGSGFVRAVAEVGVYGMCCGSFVASWALRLCWVLIGSKSVRLWLNQIEAEV